MATDVKYEKIKEKVPAIKKLFQSRHYEQCASHCEHLLNQSGKEMHPIHLAYLNFYLALSRDTMAREAGMRNRSAQLDLAEKHYLAAVTALAPSGTYAVDTTLGDVSPISLEGNHDFYSRRASDAASTGSGCSTSTRATSVGEDDHEPVSDTLKSNGSVRFTSPLPSHVPHVGNTRTRPAPIDTFTPSQHHQMEYLSTSMASFAAIIRSHLAGVRELKDSSNASTQQYSFCRSRASTMGSRPVTRDSFPGEPVWDRIRRERKSVTFRPRFDPTSVQELCNEALSEL